MSTALAKPWRPARRRPSRVERRPGVLEHTGTERQNGRRFEVLRLTPEGGRPFEMWIDADTGLIDRTVEKTSREVRTTLFSDYRPVAGLLFPFRQRATAAVR
jgi:hypothetical protein